MNQRQYTMIHNAEEYQKAFLEALDTYAANHGLRTQFRGKELSTGEIREMVDAACEDVRRIYKLSDSDHAAYKEMVLKATYGPNAGRK